MSYELLSNANYYSIDDILCESFTVPATFIHDCIGLGHLESIDNEDIAINTKLEIPYWLMQYLAMHQHITISLPARLYGNKFIDCITNDKTLYSDLASRCMYYYELGIKYCLFSDNTQLMQNLRTIYSNRYTVILHRSALQRGMDHNTFLSKLTSNELQLHDIKYYTAIQISEWKSRYSVHARAGQLNHTINVLQNITNITNKQQNQANINNNFKDNGQGNALAKQPNKYANTRQSSNYTGINNENTYASKRQRA